MILLCILGYIWIASIVTAVFGVIYEGRELPPYSAAFIGAFWLPVVVGALGFMLLIGIPYKLTKLGVDKLKKV